MITCDRCKKQIKISFPFQTLEQCHIINVINDSMIACDVCEVEHRRGLDKIRDEIDKEYKARERNWHNEWLHNYKPDHE